MDDNKIVELLTEIRDLQRQSMEEHRALSQRQIELVERSHQRYAEVLDATQRGRRVAIILLLSLFLLSAVLTLLR